MQPVSPLPPNPLETARSTWVLSVMTSSESTDHFQFL
uniref:Uncharacterized protein n=1 Tax=Arundo donax TaxID=35708 RepID=A0A0A8YXK6_ARUDO